MSKQERCGSLCVAVFTPPTHVYFIPFLPLLKRYALKLFRVDTIG